MKLTKSWILSIPILIGASLLSACTEETEAPLRRAADAVDLTYNAGASSKIDDKGISIKIFDTDGSITHSVNFGK